MTMSNLQSTSLLAIPLNVYYIAADKRRKIFWLHVTGEQTFDVAFCPVGTTDPTPYWLDGFGKDQAPIISKHTGDFFIRDTDNTGNETFHFISDRPLDITDLGAI